MCTLHVCVLIYIHMIVVPICSTGHTLIALNLMMRSPVCPHLSPVCPHLSPVCPHLSPVCPHLSPVCPHLSPVCPHFSPVCPHSISLQSSRFFIITTGVFWARSAEKRMKVINHDVTTILNEWRLYHDNNDWLKKHKICKNIKRKKP